MSKGNAKGELKQLAGIHSALLRASQAALALSKATGTPFWVTKNGRAVDLNRRGSRRRERSGASHAANG